MQNIGEAILNQAYAKVERLAYVNFLERSISLKCRWHQREILGGYWEYQDLAVHVITDATALHCWKCESNLEFWE